MSENKENKPKGNQLFLELIIAEASILSTAILTGLGLQDLCDAYHGKIEYQKGLIELGIGLITGAIASYIIYQNIRKYRNNQNGR